MNPPKSIKFPVFGIYVGNTSCSVSLCKENGLPEVVTNASGDRVTPAMLGLSHSEISIGTAVSNRIVSPNDRSYVIVSNNKSLLQTSANDSQIKLEQAISGLTIKDGCFAYEIVDDKGKVKRITPIEAYTILFKDLYETASRCVQETGGTFVTPTNKKENKNKKGVVRKQTVTAIKEPIYCVLAVPMYFSKENQNMLVKAAENANFKVLQFAHECSLAILAYNINNEVPLNDTFIFVYRAGGVSCEASLYRVSDGIIQCRSSVLDKSIGGNWVISVVQQYFIQEFERKYKISLEQNVRAKKKVYNAARDCVSLLSTCNSASTLIESLADGVDYHATLSFARFDSMLSPLINKFSYCVRKVMECASVDYKLVKKVVLCGAPLRMKNLQSHIRGFFPEAEIPEGIDPECVIACGAAAEAKLVALYGNSLPQGGFGPTATKELDNNNCVSAAS